MKKIRIGYYALSSNFSHPGDRRRVVFWAKARGHELVANSNERVDVVLVSEKADFNMVKRSHLEVPIILDLIDGYLAPEPLLSDYSRGFSKVLTRELSGFPKRYTKYISQACTEAAAVICSTREQQETISSYCPNVHIILDSHNELPLLSFQRPVPSQTLQIMWEGMPYTLRGIKQAGGAFENKFMKSSRQLKVVTDSHYFRFLGRYGKMSTTQLLAKELGGVMTSITLVPWSLNSLITTGKQSNLAVIPIDLSSPLQFLKSENRLLIMWRLGLPCLTSATPAYSRVADRSGVNLVCRSTSEWMEKSNMLLSDSDAAAETVSRGQAYIQEFHNSDILLEKWDRAIGSVI